MSRYQITGGGVYVLVDSPVDARTARDAAWAAVLAAEKVLCPGPLSDMFTAEGNAAAHR